MPSAGLYDAFAEFAKTLTSVFSPLAQVNNPAQREDQLKAPMVELLKHAGKSFNVEVEAKTEAQVKGLGGRPDMGVAVAHLLTGHVELKAPGKGASPQKFQDERDTLQWEKFKKLPNLIYTDGNEWSLFHTGNQQGTTVRLSGDVTADGVKAFTDADLNALDTLLRSFLMWKPTTPTSPQALAELIAPLCTIIRNDVAAALEKPDSNIRALAQEWRQALFSDADDARFADAYAQTVTYALLLARFNGQTDLKLSEAADALESGHGLLAQALRILGQPQAYKEIGVGIDLLQRIVSAIEPESLQHKGNDPWLYFYEDFLAAYDRKLRKDWGVYYTPAQVIKAQVRLVSKLLEGPKFRKKLSYADENVIMLDPGAGGAYPLAVLQHGLELVQAKYGVGSLSGSATEMARNIHAFEVLVGPYAVAHLRLTQKVLEAGGSLPDDDIHVYLTDTLESPHAQPTQLTLQYKQLSEEHKRAQEVKANTRVLVCMGNPPYYRQQKEQDEEEILRRGGWVRFGDKDGAAPILEGFLKPAIEAGRGGDVKNLYNDYVYFWRWALWKVFEAQEEAGIVCFITAASYLRGPGFVGMRQMMRETFDEMWVINLEGDNNGARKTDNVFAIQTPVAIALGVRYGKPRADAPAVVHYARLEGLREDKLNALDAVHDFADLTWETCFSGWQDAFLPAREGAYFAWPLLTDIFPWQYSGAQFKRTWPIGETPQVLEKRWTALVAAPVIQRALLFQETDRKITKTYPAIDNAKIRLSAISTLKADAAPPVFARYGFRSFDRRWAIADPRVCDRLRLDLWRTLSPKQVYMTSLLTEVLGDGPAATVTGDVPDLHYFSGRGGKDAIPLWRNAEATDANVTSGLLKILCAAYQMPVSAEDLFAYAYAVLAAPRYVEAFYDALTLPGPRLPITKNATLFRAGAARGRELIALHTYGERMAPPEWNGDIPQGQARSVKAVPADAGGYPESFTYDASSQTLYVGLGAFAPVSPQVWEYGISGLQVVRSWLAYRMQAGAGRGAARAKQSRAAGGAKESLDAIRPEIWTLALTRELLNLLWILEATVAQWPELAQHLDAVTQGECFRADDLPQPLPQERKPPQEEEEGEAEQESLGLDLP